MAGRRTKKAGNAPAVQGTPVQATGPVFVCSHLARGVRFDMPDGRKVTITGVNDVLRGKEHGKLIVGGGVYTKMAADDWEYISKKYADLTMVKKGMIYVERNARNARAAIKERSELRNGFEPINPEKTITKEASAATI